ncbi:MAG TPA: molybdenum cofactor guanylyltransferase [Bacteroidales bacterium]|nr:molybdenum cofactor guanylyltransferase [Bacteroidales bacterium]
MSAAVLAGGRALRFGGINKALMQVSGIPLITRITALLEPLFSEIIIAGWPAGDPLPPGVRTVADNYPGIGPLGGIEAALKASQSPSLFVFGCDMPWLSGQLISEQAEFFLRNPSDILSARSNGLPEPLHSIYSRRIHPSLVTYIEQGGSPAVIDFLKIVDTGYYDFPVTGEARKTLTNINRPEDIAT